MAVCQNLVPLVNIKIAGKWMFIPLRMVCIGLDPYPYHIFRYFRGSKIHCQNAPRAGSIGGQISVTITCQFANPARIPCEMGMAVRSAKVSLVSLVSL